MAGATTKALELIERSDDLRAKVMESANWFRASITSAGFDVDHVNAVIGSAKNTNHLELVMGTGRLEEMRVAATIYGRAVGAMHVVISVTGEKLARLGLKPNGVEVVYQLPSKDVAVLERVSKGLSKLFPDLTINPDTGFVKVLVAEKDAADLGKRLAEAKAELLKVFPMDNVGETGVARGTAAAFRHHGHGGPVLRRRADGGDGGVRLPWGSGRRRVHGR